MRRRTVHLLVLVALLVSSCGHGESASTTRPEPESTTLVPQPTTTASAATTPPPTELALLHVQCFNTGDVEGFLDAFAEDTNIGEIGTADDPDVIDAVAFQLRSVQGAAGYVATCEPWGEDGARCEGLVHDRVFSPAGLTRHLTIVYWFDEDGRIIRFGEMNVYDHIALNRFSSEFAAWVGSTHPELVSLVTEHGHIVKNRGGAAAIDALVPLVEEFIAQSEYWPVVPATPDR